MGEVRAYLHFLVICLYIAEHAVTPFVSVPWCDGSFPGYGYYDYGYFGDQPYATIEYDTPRPPLDVTSTTKPLLRRDTAGNLELVSVPVTPAPPATTATTAVPKQRQHHQLHHQPNHQPHHQPHDHLHQPHPQLYHQPLHQRHQ